MKDLLAGAPDGGRWTFRIWSPIAVHLFAAPRDVDFHAWVNTIKTSIKSHRDGVEQQ